MKKLAISLLFLFIFLSCSKELAFETRSFTKKTSLQCDDQCPQITVAVPFAENGIAADSINQTIFRTVTGIVQFGENPSEAKNYDELLASFISTYEKLRRESPNEIFGWEADLTGRIAYQSEQILNIEIKHYTFTGGAHGYGGLRSLLFDPATGKSISNAELFKDLAAFRTYAENRFREKFKIPAGASINSQGMMFENEQFHLPQNIFFTTEGILLYYNAYEIASYAEGAQELLLPYDQVKQHLHFR